MKRTSRSKAGMRSVPDVAPLARNADPDRRVLLVNEVSERLGVSVSHVLGLIDEGKIRALDLANRSATGRRALRIPVSWFEDFLRSHIT